MRQNLAIWIVAPLADDNTGHQRTDSRGDVNNDTSGKIYHSLVGKESTVSASDHMIDGQVDKECP